MPDFDRSLCWYVFCCSTELGPVVFRPDVAVGEYGSRECPFTFCSAIEGCAEVASEFRIILRPMNFRICINFCEQSFLNALAIFNQSIFREVSCTTVL